MSVGSIFIDHLDLSIFCALQRSRKIPHHLADLLIFSPRWDVADYPFQPQYYYRDRNGLMKFMDLLYGKYGGCSDDFQPGGAHMAVRAFF